MKKVFDDWAERIEDPKKLHPELQRELVADIFQEDTDYLFDQFTEGFWQKPEQMQELVKHYRNCDALQFFALWDRMVREATINSTWLETEIQDAKARNSTREWD